MARANDLHISSLASLSPAARAAILNELTPTEAAALLYDWRFLARPEQLPPKGNWRIWAVIAGRGWGKALDLKTLVPTVTGWTTMGDIQVGDQVFDEVGQPCKITYVSPIQFPERCYEVVFSDGTRVVCDGAHEWLTVDRRTRKARRRRTGRPNTNPASQPRYFPSVVTTDYIRTTLYDGKEVNHAIPCTGSLVCEPIELPIHPYVFGVWLGDGSSNDAELTCADSDSEILDDIHNAGYAVNAQKRVEGKASRYWIGGRPTRRDPKTGRMLDKDSLQSILKRLGLMGNKHIPQRYLRASIEQRLQLLQGLMDTDGFVERNGNCEYTTISPRLAEHVYELCVSLGIKAVCSKGVATLYGRVISDKYRIHFTPSIPVFRLLRKAERIKARGKQAERQRRRYIIEVREVDPVPVRCIVVDSPSHLFLVSKSMIPTHNTRVGAEWVRMMVETGAARRIALVGRTAADVREVMVDGESGLLSICPPWNRPTYQPSRRRLTWANGAVALTYSGDKPDQLRGPQHDAAWADELAAWRFDAAWHNLMMGLRLGTHPRAVVTTTPRPTRLIRDLLIDPDAVITRGTTYDNAANLAPSALTTLIRQYGGTRLGAQELEARLIDEPAGALWRRAWLEADGFRIREAPALRRIVVAVDPAVTGGAESDETGIIAAGVGEDGHGYVLDDLSLRTTPDGWARAAVGLYRRRGADRLIAEANNGGDLVAHTLATVDRRIPVQLVHASRGKAARAEPIAALYEQGRVHHVGAFAALEDQMCTWSPTAGGSPDRVDALTWALTALLLEDETLAAGAAPRGIGEWRG